MKGVLKASALFKKEKAGILMALLRHNNPGKFTDDNFLKTLYKSCALFEILSEIKKGAAQIASLTDSNGSKRF